MSYRRSAITPSNFRIGNSIMMNEHVDYQPYLDPVKDLYIHNINIHLGSGAGYEGSVYQFQGTGAVAVGGFTAQNQQGQYAVAVGYEAAQQNQGIKSVAIGFEAAQTTQGTNSVAIGVEAGQDTQGDNSVAIGINAGQDTQGDNSVAIGVYAGQTNQEPNCIAIGNGAGFTNQGITAGPTAGYSIAIGNAAGYTNQGDFTIAIGSQAGFTSQADNSIILNAQASTSLDSSTEGLFVKPVRNIDYDINYEQARYNPTSGEFTWSHAIPGIITMYGGVNSPTGYLFCNGSAVSRTTYSRLFSVIGSIYGNGDGTGTFNLPNLQGRVPVGLKATEPLFSALGNTGGTGAHTLSESEMPSHTHSGTTDETTTNSTLTNNGVTSGVGTANVATGSLAHSHTFTTNSAGGGASHNNLQPYIVLNYIISF
jgi:microcystin-dependent protein